MYRVLIVDDEPYIVDYVSSLLDEQIEPELDICHAYSGQMALEWLKRTKIDIIITDISMPEMNGIELMNEVHDNWPHCKVIILTAHAEFDYAYEAIKNNVVGYILKNQDDRSILNEIKKAIQLLDQELDKRSQLVETRDFPNQYQAAIRNEILLKILRGDGANGSALFSQLEKAGIGFNPEMPFLMMMCCIENVPFDATVMERHRQFDDMKKIVDLHLKTNIRCYPVMYQSNKFVWLLQPEILQSGNETQKTADIYNQMIVFVGGMLETVQSSSMETTGLLLSFILNDNPVPYKKLPDVFVSIERQMNHLMINQSGFIATGKGSVDETTEGDSAQADMFDPYTAEKAVKRLKNLLNYGRYNEFMMETEKTCNIIREFKGKQSAVAQEILYSVAIFINSYINQQKLTAKIPFKVDLSELFNLYEKGYLSQAMDYLLRLAQAISQIHTNEGNNATITIVQKLKAYIDKNLTGDVSLTQLSKVTGYNVSYLSRIFKQHMGITIKEYICKQKLDGIIALFSNPSLNIGDIVVKMGFTSRVYFNNFFKRMTGTSPQEYRRNQQKEM
jgi:two-component system response regulator YesN